MAIENNKNIENNEIINLLNKQKNKNIVIKKINH